MLRQSFVLQDISMVCLILYQKSNYLIHKVLYIMQLNDISSLATAHNTAMAHILYIKTKCQFTMTSQFGIYKQL